MNLFKVVCHAYFEKLKFAFLELVVHGANSGSQSNQMVLRNLLVQLFAIALCHNGESFSICLLQTCQHISAWNVRKTFLGMFHVLGPFPLWGWRCLGSLREISPGDAQGSTTAGAGGTRRGQVGVLTAFCPSQLPCSLPN